MTLQPTVSAIPRPRSVEVLDPLQRIGLSLALLAIFLRFSYFHEALDLLVGVRYIMAVVMPLSLILMLLSGGLRRTCEGKAGVAFLAYGVWLLPCIVFSSWQGGSFNYVKDYLTYHFPFLLLIGGMLMTKADIRKFMTVGAVAAVIIMIDSRLIGQLDQGGRMTMRGSIGNSNDFAALLLFSLPFLGYFTTDKRINSALRLGAMAGVAFGIYVVLSSGSRGALLSLLVMGAIIFFRVSVVMKMAGLVAFPFILMVTLSLLPESTYERITSILRSDKQDADSVKDAESSSELRRYLLRRSVELTFYRPVFGVGPGQFASYEGGSGNLIQGVRGAYNQTHNTLTQFSSEAGIPALILVLVAIVSSMRTMNRVYKEAKAGNRDEEMARMTFFLMLAATGLLLATQFLSMAQLFYYPAIAGIGLGVQRAWRRELDGMRQRTQVALGPNRPNSPIRPNSPNRPQLPLAPEPIPAKVPASARIKFTR